MQTRITAVLLALAAAIISTNARAAEEPRAKSPAKSAAAGSAATDGDAMFKKIEDLKRPDVDLSRRGDRAYVKQIMEEMTEWARKRGELAAEFIEKHPDHPRKADALYIRAESLAQTGAHHADFAEVAEAFLEAAPKDPRGAELLYHMANTQQDEAKQAPILRRLVGKYPASELAAQAKAALRQVEGIGKPFELAFTDAVSGRKISMADLKGKVVVIDFWATWCGPCVRDMPHMKELYSEYKDKGVEFIGVSLDAPEAKGGLEKLKQFVAKNEIGWPQYYQGKGWESEFSSSWGINSIPALFVVDADGKLHSTSARGRLEQMIPELLQKAAKPKPAAAKPAKAQ